MKILDIIILAFALSLDAMIVCFSYGLIACSKKLKNSIALAGFCGFFQFLMPIIGYYLSSFVYTQLKSFSKWIVFIVFIYLAFKFIKNAINKQEENTIACISLLCLLGIALATSMDALGAGISIRFTGEVILKPSLIIGILTFINSFLGFWIASLFKKIPTKYIEITGAVLLIYLAISAIL